MKGQVEWKEVQGVNIKAQARESGGGVQDGKSHVHCSICGGEWQRY